MNDPWRIAVLIDEVVFGAGVLVDERHVITCAHVVAEALECPTGSGRPNGAVEVAFPAFPEFGTRSATVEKGGWFAIMPDQRGDIAVLTLDENVPETIRPAFLRGWEQLRGHQVRIFGYPGRLNKRAATVFGVTVRARLVDASGPDAEWVQLEAVRGSGYAVQRGFSGAGVVDDSTGDVVGIVVADDRLAETRTAWMLSVDIIARYWSPLAGLIMGELWMDPAFRQHWEPRSRGVDQSIHPGWYFSGRTAVLKDLCRWLRTPAPSDWRARVITGSPGCGKSAVLARLVTLADPAYRRKVPPTALKHAAPGSLPPLGSITAAVHSAGKTVPQIVERIAEQIGSSAATPSELLEELTHRDEPAIIVFDAVDEAARPEYLIRELLSPLIREGRRGYVRTLLGTRAELLPRLRTGTKVIDLDAATFFRPKDVADYVKSYLLAVDDVSPSLYRDQPDLAATVASAVAQKAGTSFLVAQLTALDLIYRDDVIDPSLPGWDTQLPSTVGDAMDSYVAHIGQALHDQGTLSGIHDSPQACERWIRDLLTPLAFARGDGIVGDDLWAVLSTAIGSSVYSAQDVRLFYNDTPAASLLKSAENPSGNRAWRLFHEALGEYLQERRASTGVSYTQVNQVFTGELVKRVSVDERGKRLWKEADWYTRTHLAEHAAIASSLDPLVADPGFLLAANLDRLVPYLRAPFVRDRQSREAASVYLLCAHHLRTVGSADIATILCIGARLKGFRWLSDALFESSPIAWYPKWAHWLPPTTHFQLAGHVGGVGAVALGEIDGVAVAISAGYDGLIRISDLFAGLLFEEPLVGHKGWIGAIAFGYVDDIPAIVTGGFDKRVHVWNLRSGRPLIKLRPTHKEPVSAVAFGQIDGTPIVISGARDGSVWIWNLRTGSLLGDPLRTSHKDVDIDAIEFGEVDEVPVVAVAESRHSFNSDTDGTLIYTWNLRTRSLLHDPFAGHDSGVESMVIGGWSDEDESDYVPILISGDSDGSVRFWNLRSGSFEQGLKFSRGDDDDFEIVQLEFGEFAGSLVVFLWWGDSNSIEIWDLNSGKLRGRLVGHQGDVNAGASQDVDGIPIVVTGGADGSVRVWNPSAAELEADRSPVRSGDWQDALAVGELDGMVVVVGGGSLGLIDVWSLETGDQAREPLDGHRSTMSVRVYSPQWGSTEGPHTGHPTSVLGVACGRLDDLPIAVSCGADQVLRLWNLRTGTEMKALPVGSGTEERSGDREETPLAVALGQIDDQAIAVGSGNKGSVWSWDLYLGTQLHAPLTGHEGWVGSVAFGKVDATPIVITGGRDGTVRVWDLLIGREWREPLTGHDGWVASVAFGMVDSIPVAVSGGFDRIVRIWNLQTDSLLDEWSTGHSAPIYAVTIGELGSRKIIATGGPDGTVRVLDVRTRRTEILFLGSTVNKVAIAPGGALLVATSAGLACVSEIAS